MSDFTKEGHNCGHVPFTKASGEPFWASTNTNVLPGRGSRKAFNDRLVIVIDAPTNPRIIRFTVSTVRGQQSKIKFV